MSQFGDTPTIEELRIAAESGDRYAFWLYCAESLPALYRYMAHQCSVRDVCSQLVADFCHDAILKAADDLDRKATAGKKISVSLQWLKTIAYRVMLDYITRSGRWVSSTEVGDYYEDVEEDAELVEEVLKYFQWLRASEQEIIEQILVKKKTITEAADELGISEDASKRRYYRAIGHLRDFIREHGTVPIQL